MSDKYNEPMDSDDFEDITVSNRNEGVSADEYERTVRDRSGSQPDNAAGRYLNHLDSLDEEDGFESVSAGRKSTVADEIRARAAMGDQAYAMAKKRAAERARAARERTAAEGREADAQAEGSGSRRERRRRSDRRSADRPARERYESSYSGSSGRRGGGGGWKIILALIILLLVAAGGVAGAYGFRRMQQHNSKVAFYKEHFLPYTVINGIDCTDKTPEEVKQILESQMDGYKLTLMTLDSEETITGEDADLKLNLSVNVDDILASQDHEAYDRTQKQSQTESVESAVEINEDKLRETVKALPEFQNMTDTQDAEASFDEATGMYVLKEPVTGTKVDVNAVADRVVEAVKSLSDTVDLKAEGFYTEPQPATQEMLDEVESMNRYLKADVELTFGSAGTEKLPKETILACLTQGEEGIVFDSTAIAQWVAGLAEKYDTYKKEHTFNTSNGKTIKLSGAYGWLMDQEATRDKVVETVKAGGSMSEDPEYSRTANSHGNDDFGGTYVEVNLNEQHMYYYKEGSLVLDSKCVSGNVSNHKATPTGLFFIYAKERNRILHGENNSYNTEVKYWMPFDGGVGLHDAWWRSNFGGSIYLEHGSHGCVNLPSSVAEELYGIIEVGTPVIVFGGVQSHETKAEEKKKETEASSEDAENETLEPETTETSEDTETEAEDDEDEEDETTRAEEPEEDEQPAETEAPETEPTKKETEAEETTTKEKKTTEAAPEEPADDENDDDGGEEEGGGDDEIVG